MKKIPIFLLLFENIVFSAINVDWTLPSLETEPTVISYSSITVDGNITPEEWKQTVCFPVRSTYHIAQSKNHIWKGPEDAGAEFYWAWNESGIFFAAIVADNEVINNMPDNLAYQQDCIELFIDGRRNLFMQMPYTKGCYHILIKPPVNGKQPSATVLSVAQIKGIRCAGKTATQTYSIELFIPWSAFPEIRQPFEGSDIAVQFMLDDYDRIDRDSVQPFSMSYLGRKELYRNPEKFVRCVLSRQAGPESGPHVSIEIQSVILEKKTVPVAIETGSMTYDDIESVKVNIESKDGKILSGKTAKITRYSDCWKNAIRAQTNLDLKKINEDRFLVSAILKDKQGDTTIVRKPVFFAGNLMAEILSEIQKADIRNLSQKEPFRAAAFLGTASCYEKIKRTIELNDTKRLQFSVRETAARFDVLNKKILKKTDTLIDLLALSAEPEAQVVVEYPSNDTAVVTFYWASIPLVSVNVKKFRDPTQVQIAAREKIPGFVDLLEDKNPAGPVVIAGLPARASSWSYSMFYFNIKSFDPEKQMLVVVPEKRILYVIDNEKVDNTEVDAIVVSEDASENTKNLVRKYAGSLKKKLQFLGIDDAMKTPVFLFACGKNNLPELFPGFRAYRVRIVKQAIIRIPFKDMLVSVSHPSRWVAEKAAGLVIRGNPVLESDVDGIRKILVKEFAFSMKSSENVRSEGFVFCGDLHAHSNFSDGYLSPVGITLESMYCFMDFFALTDHNTIDGALIVSNLLSKNSFSYTFIVGQEITTGDFHMNGYPLKKVISWNTTADVIIKDVHSQNAVIQWNHPGWTNSEWELTRIDSGLSGLDVDAWEHIPSNYYEWKKKAELPALIGSTDSHDGTFSNPERTIIFSTKLSEKGIVNAIKNHNTVLISPSKGSDFLYGESTTIADVWDIISQGYEMKKVKENQIRKMLRNADVVRLLQQKYTKNSTGD